MTILRLLPIVLCTALLSACAHQDEQSLVADISPGGGESMTKVREPIYLTATRPGLSQVGKDYLFASPVTVSGSGPVQSYLWFAVGSTIDRYLTGSPEPTLDTILLVVDGVPMTFDLVPWSTAAQYAPYKIDVKTQASYAARVTRSQLRVIANATELTAYVTSDDHRSPQYQLDQGELQAWLDF